MHHQTCPILSGGAPDLDGRPGKVMAMRLSAHILTKILQRVRASLVRQQGDLEPAEQIIDDAGGMITASLRDLSRPTPGSNRPPRTDIKFPRRRPLCTSAHRMRRVY